MSSDNVKETETVKNGHKWYVGAEGCVVCGDLPCKRLSVNNVINLADWKKKSKK